MRITSVIIFIALSNFIYSNNSIDSLLNRLDEELALENNYISKKIEHINLLQNKLSNENSIQTRHEIYNLIFDEYKSFNFDSPFNYLMELKTIPGKMDDVQKAAKVNIKLGFIYASSGMFKEALDKLATIHPENLDSNTRTDYYSTMAAYYYNKAYQLDKYYSLKYEKELLF